VQGKCLVDLSRQEKRQLRVCLDLTQGLLNLQHLAVLARQENKQLKASLKLLQGSSKCKEADWASFTGQTGLK
jgi:hypothetical protein